MKKLVPGFTAIFILLMGTISYAHYKDSQIVWKPYQVAYGDSLWKIAEEHPIPGYVEGDLVAMMSEHNKIGGYLQPGDVIQIPAVKGGGGR
jgi:LysM repeat protein